MVGYDDYSWDISDQGLDIFYGQPVELLSYASGTDLLAELHAEIARERESAQACPAGRRRQGRAGRVGRA
ncbi:MAG TPA: hypothetical protein VHZ03_18475 [Trebonia sp.]|nr:hypothetical protein [Trebonia sp.]